MRTAAANDVVDFLWFIHSNGVSFDGRAELKVCVLKVPFRVCRVLQKKKQLPLPPQRGDSWKNYSIKIVHASDPHRSCFPKPVNQRIQHGK